MIPISILDLTPIKQGGSVAATLRETLELARHAEALGYHRYWLVEHHNTPSVAGAATAVVMAHVAAAHQDHPRRRRRHHAAQSCAASWWPSSSAPWRRCIRGASIWGWGAASPAIRRPCRRCAAQPGDMAEFPRDVQELLFFLRPAAPGQKVRAIPGEGADVPVWILGSSLGGAELAASLGLPFAFASHFAPDQLEVALAAYRGRFMPSAHLDKPQVMLSLTVVAADTRRGSAAAVLHARSRPPMRRCRRPLPIMKSTLDPQRLALIQQSLSPFVVGGPDTVAKGVADFIARYRPDEVIVTAQIFDPAARLQVVRNSRPGPVGAGRGRHRRQRLAAD